jgi:hypothetical protein
MNMIIQVIKNILYSRHCSFFGTCNFKRKLKISKNDRLDEFNEKI